MTMTMMMMIVRYKARPRATDIDYFGILSHKNASGDHKLLGLMITITAD